MNGKIMSLAAAAAIALGAYGAAPYDCELEYLTVSKGVYFDTGVCVTSAPTAHVKFALHDNYAIDVFGSATAVAGCFILNCDHNYIYYRYGTASYSGLNANPLSVGTVYDYVCAQSITENGATVYTSPLTPTWSKSSSVTVPGRRYLGALTVYAFSIAQDGVTACDCVPVMKNGTAALYDKISGTLIYPAGGAASAGPIKNNATVALAYEDDAVNATDYADTTLTVDVAEGKTATLAGNITGTSRLVKTGAGTLRLTGTGSDYAGGVELRGGILNTQTAQGYGTGNILINPDAGVKYSLQFAAPGARFANAVTALKSIWYNALGNFDSHVQFLADTTLDGPITSNCNDQQFHIGATNGVTVTLNGDVLGDYTGTIVFWAFGDMIFNGKVDCKYAGVLATWNTEGTITFNNPSNRIAYYGETHPADAAFDTYSPVIKCGAANVISNLLWRPSYRFTVSTYNRLDLNGHDQVIRGMTTWKDDYSTYVVPGFQQIDAITNASTRGYAVYYDSRGALQCSTDAPATLTLTGTGAGTTLVTPEALNGALSIVLDADATHETVLSNRTNTMTGSIRVKKGTLSANLGASFANASAVKVDAGAAFRLDTVATNALKSVKRFEIDGTFSFTSTAPQQIAYCDVVLGADASFTIPAGAYCVKSLTVGGETYTEGTFGAGGTAVAQLPAGVTLHVTDQLWPIVLDEPIYEFEVAAGETNRLNDATVKVTQGGSTTTVAFSTLADPTAGTIVKKGSGVLVSSKRLAAFVGTVLVEAGGFAIDDNLEVGPQTAGATTVWVRDGASFIVQGTKDTCGKSNLKLYHNMHLKGTGLNGLGAVDMEHDVYQNYAFTAGTWTLDGDALISGRTTQRADLGSVTVDLNGHALSRGFEAASCPQHVWSYVTLSTPGTIRVADKSQLLIQALCNFCTYGESEIVLTNGATLGYYNSAHRTSQRTKIVFAAGGSPCAWSNGGGTDEKSRMLPGDVKQGWWDGPVQVDGTAKVYGTCDYKGLAFRGKVSGSGDLLLSSGWMHFYSPENDFNGALAFTEPLSSSYASFVKGIAVYTNGALPVACRSVTITNAPLALMNSTAFDLPAMTYCVKADLDYSFYGGTGGTLAELVKTGAGTLTLSAPVAVTGRLEVAEGTLKVTANDGLLNVGTYVPGAGTIDGSLSITDALQPGDAAGRVTGTVAVGADAVVSLAGHTLSKRAKILTADGGVTLAAPIPVVENPDLVLYARGDSLYVGKVNGTTMLVR